MSAFMVADETINKIVSWLEREMYRSRWFEQQVYAYIAEHDISLDTWQKDLAERMFQLNIDGVEARYGKGKATDFRDLDFRYELEMTPTDIHALKSMNCWLYQCMEGDVTQQSLYRFFHDVVVRYLLEKIVYNLPAYNQAEYG